MIHIVEIYSSIIIYLSEPRNLGGLVLWSPAKIDKLSGTKALYAVGVSTESTEVARTAVNTKDDLHAGGLLYST